MRLLAIAVAGLEVQVAVAALGLQSDRITRGSQALTVLMGILFLVALVLPSFVRVFLIKREDVAFRRAMGDLVSARESRDVAERLLPHVCALVGASKAALLAGYRPAATPATASDTTASAAVRATNFGGSNPSPSDTDDNTAITPAAAAIPVIPLSNVRKAPSTKN